MHLPSPYRKFPNIKISIFTIPFILPIKKNKNLKFRGIVYHIKNYVKKKTTKPIKNAMLLTCGAAPDMPCLCFICNPDCVQLLVFSCFSISCDLRAAVAGSVRGDNSQASGGQRVSCRH